MQNFLILFILGAALEARRGVNRDSDYIKELRFASLPIIERVKSMDINGTPIDIPALLDCVWNCVAPFDALGKRG